MQYGDTSNEPVVGGEQSIPSSGGTVRIARGSTYLALAVCVVGVGAAFAAGVPRTRIVAVPETDRGRVVITGCPSEDSCRIDYRRGPDGEPVWVIRAQTP